MECSISLPWGVNTQRLWLKTILMASTVVAGLAACDAGKDEPSWSAPTAQPHQLSSQRQQSVAHPAPKLATITVPELLEQLSTGATTSRGLTEAYLARIAQIDQAGPTLRAVIAINPNAIAQAEASDQRRAAGAELGALDGVPILIKDNIETADPIPTTAGSLALIDNLAGRDSPAVASLRAQGAVILGKTNLSQWANFRSDFSVSGWSSVGGQVKNPHILDRSPCGSSSGSGVAIAAGLAALAIGTETNGSIICPSNVNGIVGFKPTLGLIPQVGIVPISPSQDTAGPMARTVRGAALMLDGMTGEPGRYSDLLEQPHSLSGVTIGVMRFAQGDNPDIISRFNAALDLFKKAGATLIEVNAFTPADPQLRHYETVLLQTEFKASLNAYLASTPDTVAVRNLAQLIEFNQRQANRELALFGQNILIASEGRPNVDDADYHHALTVVKQVTGELGIDRLLQESGAAVLVAPSGPIAPPRDPINGDVWPSWVGIGYMAAMAGYPHLSVPMGTINGVPVGLSIIAGANADQTVLAIGHQWQQLYGAVPEPKYTPSAETQPEIAEANHSYVAIKLPTTTP